MGDLRYAEHYEKVRAAIDRVGEIEQMTDDELVQALGAASRAHDPYLANVLTTAVLNRTRRGRAVTENIGDGVCVVDREGVITFANPAASAILGWTMKELQGMQFHAIVHHHLGSVHDQMTDCPLKKALGANAAARSEDVFAPRTGPPIAVSFTVSTIVVDGLADSTVVLFQDITERQRAQALLVAQTRVMEGAVEKTLAQLLERERAEVRFAGLFAAHPEAVVMANADGAIVLANHAAARMFGYANDELVGQPATVLLPASHRSTPSSPGPTTPLAGPDTEPAARIGIVGRRKDGTEFPIEVRSSVFDDPSGPLVITSIREIDPSTSATTVEQLRTKLATARNDLEREVATRTESLTRSYRELEAFSYSVSHDLQAPLRMLEFLVSSTIKEHRDADPALREDLARMAAQVERLRDLVSAILRLAKVGVKLAERDRVDVSALAAEIAEDMRRLHPGRAVVITIQPGLTAEADPTLLRALLENLLSNAWKYTSDREVAHVWVGAHATHPPTFFVRDDGQGFDIRHAPRLFQPFSRLASSGPREGVGVGLASARRVVEGHGGRIWAESAPGEGATFFFTLAPTPTGDPRGGPTA